MKTDCTHHRSLWLLQQNEAGIATPPDETDGDYVSKLLDRLHKGKYTEADIEFSELVNRDLSKKLSG